MWQVLVYNARCGQWYVMFSHVLKAKAENAVKVYLKNDMELSGKHNTYAVLYNGELA